MPRQRLRQLFSQTEASAGTNIYQSWPGRPKDILVYSVTWEFKTSKAPILCMWEHGKAGTSTWKQDQVYSSPARHATYPSHAIIRYDRPEYVPQGDKIAVAAKTNEAADTVNMVIEYEDVT